MITMSAWIVSKTHIDYLVTALIRAELTDKSPDEAGRMLWRECLASVAWRYPNDGDGGRPGPVGFHDSEVDTYTWAETPELLNSTQDELHALLDADEPVNDLGGQDPYPRLGADQNDLDEEI